MKTIRRGKNNGEAENAVIIDLDSDSFTNLKLEGSNRLKSDKNVPLKTYVYIIDDDDENPDEKGQGVVPTVDCSHGYEHKHDKSKKTPTSDDAPVEGLVVNQREKIKEIHDYRRALEEDLSATQIALRVQAEEAQQLEYLLKKKEAEKFRLLEMERTQKQRVREIREAQKKATENLSQPRVGKKRSACVLDTKKKEKLPCPENTSHQKAKVSSQQDPSSVETVDCSPCFRHKYNNSRETATRNALENEGKRILTSPSSDGVPGESSIVSESEKFNEFERELEEKLSARQRALKVQSEEAKRKAAKKVCLSYMKKRQKHVEELKGNQKKSSENTSQPRGRKRGSISLRKKDKSKNKQKLEIEFNEKGLPFGANQAKFTIYVGVKTRMMISILKSTWNKVPKTDIHNLWLDIKEHWSIKNDEHKKQVVKICNQAWRNYKSRLIRRFLRKNKNPVPSSPYLDESTWQQFVALQSQTKKFQMERDVRISARRDWVPGAGVDP